AVGSLGLSPTMERGYGCHRVACAWYDVPALRADRDRTAPGSAGGRHGGGGRGHRRGRRPRAGVGGSGAGRGGGGVGPGERRLWRRGGHGRLRTRAQAGLGALAGGGVVPLVTEGGAG